MSELQPKEAFARFVRAYRIANSLSVRDMEEMSGVDKSLISRIENNQSDPCLSAVAALCGAMNMSIDLACHPHHLSMLGLLVSPRDVA